MSLKIICSGHLIRHPLGGHTWHHLQYLLGLERLGHEVLFFEDFGWPNSCYNAATDEMTSDPSFGIAYFQDVIRRSGFDGKWCYLAEDGSAHGMPREALAQACRESDVYFNLSNINWIDELKLCRRRVLVDTDPVFTQIQAHGMGGPFENYHALFTYGENVHKPGCEMPTGGKQWLATRQPVVMEMWPVRCGDAKAAYTTVVNWTAYGDQTYQGRTYGQKDREFKTFFDMPRESGQAMEIALNASREVKKRFAEGGWRFADPLEISRDPWSYQAYVGQSKGEFCVAKHGYVSTRCGWFSDRSSAYLAMGRPVILQDTGFSEVLPCGTGLLAYGNRSEAFEAIATVEQDYQRHCEAARGIAEGFFDSRLVLGSMLERSV
jgi:hypothetical protein